jgi:peroxiredoxin Q/BCP
VIRLIAPGEKAPDFEAPSTSGTTLRLSSLRGRIVVLYFYPRAMTSGCTREAQRFNELIEEFNKYNAIVIGVSTDPIERNKRFAEKLGLKFTLLSDENGDIARMYGVLKPGARRASAQRVTFVIDENGVVRKVIKNIRPAERHADEALQAVKELALNRS